MYLHVAVHDWLFDIHLTQYNVKRTAVNKSSHSLQLAKGCILYHACYNSAWMLKNISDILKDVSPDTIVKRTMVINLSRAKNNQNIIVVSVNNIRQFPSFSYRLLFR